MKTSFFAVPWSLLPVLWSVSQLSGAHGLSYDPPPQGINASAAFTYRSDNAIDDGESWQIPGIMLGGEAFPAEQGARLDDSQLNGVFHVSDDYFAEAKISAHQHDSETEFELESLYFSAQLPANNLASLLSQPRWSFAIGKMTSLATATASHHASTSLYSEAPLLADVFFGRHFTDIGGRAELIWDTHRWGLEAWDGDSFPATSGAGGASTYMHFNQEVGEVQLRTGGWMMMGKAEQRRNGRYESDHHLDSGTTEQPDLSFSGDTLMTGAFAEVGIDVSGLLLTAAVEWIRADIEGELQDPVSSAQLDSQVEGTRLLFGVAWQQHRLSAQYERLSSDNDFRDTSLTFVQQAGLYNDGFEPEKLSLAWLWSFHEDFALRAEWVADDSLPATAGSNETTSHNRWVIGLVWQRKLL